MKKYDTETVTLARAVNNLFAAINTTRSCNEEEMWKALEEFGVRKKDIELSNTIMDYVLDNYESSLHERK